MIFKAANSVKNEAKRTSWISISVADGFVDCGYLVSTFYCTSLGTSCFYIGSFVRCNISFLLFVVDKSRSEGIFGSLGITLL